MTARKTEKKLLTAKFVEGLKGDARVILDTDVRGFGVRLGASGGKVYVLTKRFPGHPKTTTRVLGSTDALTLSEARDKARDWIKSIAKGVDPTAVEKQKLGNTFSAVTEAYIAEHLKAKRRGAKDTQEIRREILPVWKDRPIADISRLDVIALIKPIARRAPTTAHLILNHVKRIFSWAVHEGAWGLEYSPALMVSPKKLIGQKNVRQRVLSDDELRALWVATDQMPYPLGPFYRMVLLTGGWREEVAAMKWSEVDGQVWTVPPERFKSNASHRVTLSDEALKVLKSVPRYDKGDFVFSSDGGRTRINGFSNAKGELLALMKHSGENFVIHDLRRTFRTRLSSLRIADNVAEMCIGHGKRGLQRVYDQHSYEDEMRSAFDAWANLLRSIIDPPSRRNVRKLRA
jgi:integrase